MKKILFSVSSLFFVILWVCSHFPCSDLFFRQNPFGGEFTIFAGLEECLRYIACFKVKSTDIEMLKTKYPEWDEVCRMGSDSRSCRSSFFVSVHRAFGSGSQISTAKKSRYMLSWKAPFASRVNPCYGQSLCVFSHMAHRFFFFAFLNQG
jgi:hypothetical protein